MPKTLFVNKDDLERIDLGDGFWADIPEQISYEEGTSLLKGKKESADSEEMGMIIMVKLIKAWNISEEDGKVASITEENIRRLPIPIINKISAILTPKISLDKKK